MLPSCILGGGVTYVYSGGGGALHVFLVRGKAGRLDS